MRASVHIELTPEEDDEPDFVFVSHEETVVAPDGDSVFTEAGKVMHRLIDEASGKASEQLMRWLPAADRETS